MDIQFMKDYYDLRYEETDGENHFVEETAYQGVPVTRHLSFSVQHRAI